LIDRIIAGIDRDANLELLEDLCQTMTDGSLCAMGGLTPMPVQSALKYFPDDFDRSAVEHFSPPPVDEDTVRRTGKRPNELAQ
jgi:formate dehydrogenase iron-sulfur subunit